MTSPDIRRPLFGGLSLLLGFFLAHQFYGAAAYYDGFLIPYEGGHAHIMEAELAFLLLYATFGLATLAALAAGLHLLGLARPAEDAVHALSRRPLLFIAAGALLFICVTTALRLLVFLDVPVQYDEFSYRFLAQTLLEGRLVNPLPGDEIFFSNTSEIIMNQQGWFSKYPIGHGLVLSLGELFGWAGVRLVPVFTGALTFAITVLVGVRLFGVKVGTLAGLLLLLSPQHVLSSATLVSQTSSTLMVIAGIYLTLRLEERPTALRALAAAGAWSFGVLVRPLPLSLCAAAAAGWVLVRIYRDGLVPGPKRLRLFAAAALPVLLAATIVGLQHMVQSGDPLVSGYRTYQGHGNFGILDTGQGQMGLSVLGAALRQSFWLHGWPLSFVFLPFLLLSAAPRGRRVQLVWLLIGAIYLYRALVPKTYVNTTGPSYVTEAVPLLILLSAQGIVTARGWLREVGLPRLAALIPAVVVAATVVMLVLFLPPNLRSIHRSADFWRTPYRLLERADSGKALVFSTILTPVGSGWTWAIRPPPPSPDLDDEVLFVLIDMAPGGMQRMHEFWQRRFPDRSPWFYVLNADGSRHFRRAFVERGEQVDIPAEGASPQ